MDDYSKKILSSALDVAVGHRPDRFSVNWDGVIYFDGYFVNDELVSRLYQDDLITMLEGVAKAAKSKVDEMRRKASKKGSTE